MADLRIVDAPEIPTENITGEEKLPTGGSGNYSISLDSLADYTKTKKDLADNITVDNKVNGVRQELDAHIEDLLNPHQVTKGQIGLGNVDNTADADKPVSNSTQAAIISAVAPKADKTYVDNQLTLKANKADVYTKQESSDLVNNSISTALTPVNTSLDLAKRGVINRYDPLLTYNSGERVVLTNGDIVKSTVDGNTNDPNVDMTGWVNPQVEQDLLNAGFEKYKYPVLYATNLKTDGTDQLDELNALAAEAVSKKLELILPLGTITVRDEFIPPDRLKMSSISTVATWSVSHTGTIIKWGGSNGVGKAVLRCSRSPIGITPTQAITAVELDGIHVDATGCDYGAYFRYFTNESRVKNLVVRNSTKCNIWGGQLWFSWFDQLTSMTAQDKGIVFGIPLAGETGDLAVNAINFPYTRSHSSGQAGTYDATTNPDGGCGFLFNTQACSYGLIQSESNGGSGVINRSNSRENTLNGMYLENNCQTDTVNTLKNAYVQDSGSTATPVTLHGVTLAANQVIYNKGTITPIYIGDLIPIDRTYQCLNGQVGSAGFSFIGFESPALEGMSADEQSRLIKHTSRSYYDLYDINLRYTSQISNVKFRTLNATEYVHLVIIPKGLDIQIPCRASITIES